MSARGDMVGRACEKERLREALEKVERGGGDAIVIRSPAGMGKSMLAAWLVAEAAARTPWTWTLCCEPFDASRPLGPFVDGLAVDARRDSVAARAALEAIAAVPAQDLVSDRVPWMVTDRLLDYVEAGSRAAGGVVVFEDAHWADPTSLAVLRRLMRTAADLRCLVVATERADGGADGNTLGLGVASVLQLEPLTDDEVTSLARAWGAEPLDEVVHVLAVAGGNPLFATELLRAWDGTRGFTTAPRGRSGLPHDVQAAVVRRVQHLPAPAVTLVRAAAVLGTTFTAHECAAMLHRPASELLPAVELCIGAWLLQEAPDGRLAFRHDLVRDAVYGSLPRTVVAALHREAAAVLAEMGAPPERITTHLLRATDEAGTVDVRTVVDYATAIADRAPRAACDLLERALALGTDSVQREDVVLQLTQLLPMIGRPQEAESLARDLLGHSRGGATATAARLALVRALFAQGRAGEVAHLLDDLRDEESPASTRILGEAAFFLSATGDLPAATPYAAAALSRDRSQPDDAGAVAALVTVALAHGFAGEFPQGLEAAVAAYDRARQAASREGIRYAPAFIVANAMANLDRWDDAQRWLRQLAEEVSDYSITLAEPVVSFGRILFGWCRSEFDDVLAECDAAVAFVDDTGIAVTEAIARIVPALVRLERGDLAGAAVLRDEAAAALAQRPSSYGADWLPWLQARLELASGSPAQARQTMEATWAALDGMGARWGLRAFGVDLVRAEREAGDVAAARRYADRLAELADTMTAPSAHASAARGRALAYLDVAAAEDAVRFAERSGRPLELAHTYEDAAATLLHAGSPERAGELLSAALSIAEQLQARATADRVVGAMRELNPANPAPRVRPVRAASGWDSLTKTEHEVVRRVAEGHTNREVAELLFISRYTVETHLKRIFTKVGVRSRTELAHRYATWAATRH